MNVERQKGFESIGPIGRRKTMNVLGMLGVVEQRWTENLARVVE